MKNIYLMVNGKIFKVLSSFSYQIFWLYGKIFILIFDLFFYRYRTTGTNARQNTCYTFSLLLDLMQFFDYYHAGQLEVALDVS